MYALIGQFWKCMTTMLLEDSTNKELNEEDATILVLGAFSIGEESSW